MKICDEYTFDDCTVRTTDWGFKVYSPDGDYLGSIQPADVADFNACVKALNEGESPIEGHWEDGNGNSCTEDGWENEDEV